MSDRKRQYIRWARAAVLGIFVVVQSRVGPDWNGWDVAADVTLITAFMLTDWAGAS